MLIKKVDSSLQRTRSNLIVSNSISRANSSRQSRCLNLKVPQSSIKLLRSHLNLQGSSLSIASLKYESDYKHIAEIHKIFFSVSNHFFSLVHEVCFKDFSIQDGLFIMLLMIYTQPEVKVKFISRKPFFHCEGKIRPETEKIIKAWEELIEFLIGGIGDDLPRFEKAVLRVNCFICMMHDRLESEVRPKGMR